MFAVIETGGKQYRVESGSFISVEKIPGVKGEKVELKAIFAGEGDKIYTENVTAKVTAEIYMQGKESKIIVYKYKAKKNVRKKQGHRQPFTKLKILSVEA